MADEQSKARLPESKPKDSKQVPYTEEQVKKWTQGAMNPAALGELSGPEMMEMAVTGFAMYEQGRYQEAKTIFHGLATLDPKESYYRTALGAVYLAEERLDEALAELDAALKLNAADIAAVVNRGEVRLRKGLILEAAEDFRRAVDLDPDNKDPLSMRARALAAAALQTLEQRGPSEDAGDKASVKKAKAKG